MYFSEKTGMLSFDNLMFVDNIEIFYNIQLKAVHVSPAEERLKHLVKLFITSLFWVGLSSTSLDSTMSLSSASGCVNFAALAHSR